MTHAIANVRYAFRKFRRAPGLILATIITLVFGIGANTAIFSLVDGIWLRPLPITDPAHLVIVENTRQQILADSDRSTFSSHAEFLDLRERVPAFADVAASSSRGTALETGDGYRLLLANVVSENYFSLMGVNAELGRLPTEKEFRTSEVPLIVLGYRAWRDEFGGSPDVIGRVLKVKGGVAKVVAILSQGFRGTSRFIDPQVYVPQSTWDVWHPGEKNAGRLNRQFEIYARLKPGATLEQAQSQLVMLGKQLASEYPQANAGRTFAAAWHEKFSTGRMRMLSILLLAIAAAVLLIACANITNLLLALNDGRRREIAMRVALGASRGQLLRQLLIESVLLATLGIAGALVLAQRVIALIPALLPNLGYPLGFDFRIDSRVLAFTTLAGFVSVLICGVIPGLVATRVSPLDAMRVQVPSSGRTRMPGRKALVIAQLAVAVSLLTATGLLVRTLLHIHDMDLGFNKTENAVLLELAVDRQDAQRQAEFESLVSRMRGLPGVKDASVARVVPFPDSGGGATKVVLAPGEVPSPTAGSSVWFNWVDEGYFRVLGVPILRGRAFERRDSSGIAPVAILNQTLAKRLFGSEDVIGRHLRIGRDHPIDAEIVGVAEDGKYAEVTEVPQPYLYLPLTQDAWSEVTLIVTTHRDPSLLLPAVRKAAREVDPNIVILSSHILADRMRLATYPNRLSVWLTASLAGLALLLTMVGLYGVTAYSVSRRTHAIGICMALGAVPASVLTSVAKDGLRLAGIGIALGTGLAVLLGRAISSLIYGVKAFDPTTLVGVISLVLGTSIVALIAPARRALQINPVDALREE